MITILLEKILAALIQLLGNIKTKLNTIKDNLDNLIVVNSASGPIASFTTTLTRPLLSCIVDVPESVSGIDTIIVTLTGKNRGELSETNKVNVSPNASYTFENNGITVNASGTYARVAFGYKVETGKKYTVSFYGYGSANFKNVYYNNAAEWGDTYGRTALTTTRTKFTKTITANSDFLFVGFYDTSSGTTGDMIIEDFMIEEGETATTFEEYSATTKTVSLPETVYGGEVDILDLIKPDVITAKNGVNNIFSDSGDVTVEYLKLYKED